jgi:hypothetical protein
LTTLRRQPALDDGTNKTAAAGLSSSRCHETPLEAPREFKKLTARPRSEARMRHYILVFFFFFDFFDMACVLVE